MATTTPTHFIPLGTLRLSRGVAELVQQGTLDPTHFLVRHIAGDWGEVSDYGRKCNDAALHSGRRLFSSYRITASIDLRIVTESDRSRTTLMLPQEFSQPVSSSPTTSFLQKTCHYER